MNYEVFLFLITFIGSFGSTAQNYQNIEIEHTIPFLQPSILKHHYPSKITYFKADKDWKPWVFQYEQIIHYDTNNWLDYFTLSDRFGNDNLFFEKPTPSSAKDKKEKKECWKM